MRPFFALLTKDLKLHFGDRRALLMTLAVPIAIASFFGFVMGGQSGKPKGGGITIQVVDFDGGPITSEIVTNLTRDENLRVFTATEAEARDGVLNGRVPVAVIFPAGFGEAAAKSFFGWAERPELTILHDPSHNAEVSLVQGLLMQHVMETVSRELFTGPTGKKVVKESIESLAGSPGVAETDRAALTDFLRSVDRWMDHRSANPGEPGRAVAPGGGLKMPFTTRSEALTKQVEVHYNGYAHSFAGMGVQFVLMAAIEAGIGILAERRRGLWRRLRAAPLARSTLLGARAASGTVISLVTMGVCWAFAILVFRVQVGGSWVGFIATNVAFAALASSFGLFIAAVGRTPEATRGVAIFAVLILVMLGGAWVPTFIFPAWLQSATLAVPTRWAIDGMEAMTWRGLGLSAAGPPIAVLLGYSALFGGLALYWFQWDSD